MGQRSRNLSGRHRNPFIDFLLNYNVLKLARELECSPTCIYNWRNETARPAMKQAQKLIDLGAGRFTLKDIYLNEK